MDSPRCYHYTIDAYLVDMVGFEPTAYYLQSSYSSRLNYTPKLRRTDLNCRTTGYEPVACIRARLPRSGPELS